MGLSETQIIVILLLAAVAAIAVATEKSDKRMTRYEYFGVFGAVVVANIVLNMVSGAGPGMVVGLVALAINFGVYYLFTRASVRRARDAGIPKGYCYLFAFPPTGLLLMLVLFVKPAPGRAAPAASS